MNSLTIYFILMLDNISTTLVTFTVFSAIIIVILILVVALQDYDDDRTRLWKTLKLPIILTGIFCFICSLCATLVPNSKQMAVILVVPKIINVIETNEEIKKLPDNVLKLANDWIVELSPSQDSEEVK